jgi:hypothetical protein
VAAMGTLPQTINIEPPAAAITKKTYLLPVSNGILDHREKIGSAIWLFILLIDWTTNEEDGVGKVRGGKPIKIKDLMQALHLKERQLRSELQRLKQGGYVRLTRTPYGYSIEVMKSKKFIHRDRQKVAALSFPDRQKTAALNGETGRKLPLQTGRKLPEQRRPYRRDIKERAKGKPSRSKNSDSDPRIKDLTDTWAALYLARSGNRYHFTGKDFGLFQSVLRTFDLPRLKDLMARFFDNADRWVTEKAGFTVGVFVSKLNSLASTFNARLNGAAPAEMTI